MATKNKYWFEKRKGKIPLYPATWQGLFVVGLYIGFLIIFFMAVDMNSHSVSDTLYGFVPKFFIITSLFVVTIFTFGEDTKIKKN